MIAAHPVWRRGGRNPIASGTIQDPPLRPGKCGSSYQKNDGLPAVPAIFELTGAPKPRPSRGFFCLLKSMSAPGNRSR